jgi:hypothetical protein
VPKRASLSFYLYFSTFFLSFKKKNKTKEKGNSSLEIDRAL